MWQDDKEIQQTIAQMNEQTNQLSSPDAATAAQRNATASGRIHNVIVQGTAEPPGPPQPLRGMGWGYAPKQSR
jgi:hypothetical protein